MKKKLLFITIGLVLSCWITTESFAQGFKPSNSRSYKSSGSEYFSRVDNTRFHYGYSVGLGVFDYRITNIRYGKDAIFQAEPVTFSPAFRLGVIGEWHLTKYLSVRAIPGLYFGKRTITFQRELFMPEYEDQPDESGYPKRIEADIKSVYADIPLLLKVRGMRIKNHNFYFLAGASCHFDLTPHKELEPDKNRIIRTKRSDLALELGGGVDFYLKYFRLGAELRISIGLVDVMNHDLVEDMSDYHIYTQTIGQMKSTLVTLAFNFE